MRGILLLVATSCTLPVLPLTPAQATSVEPDSTFSGDGRAALNVRGYDHATDVVIDGNVSYLIGSTKKSRGGEEDLVAVGTVPATSQSEPGYDGSLLPRRPVQGRVASCSRTTL